MAGNEFSMPTIKTQGDKKSLKNRRDPEEPLLPFLVYLVQNNASHSVVFYGHARLWDKPTTSI